MAQTLIVTLSESLCCDTVGNTIHINLKTAYQSIAAVYDGYIVATITDFVKVSTGYAYAPTQVYNPCTGCVECKSVYTQNYNYQYTFEYEDSQTNPSGTLITEAQIESYCCASCVDLRSDVQILTQEDVIGSQFNQLSPPVGTKFWEGSVSFTNTLDRPATAQITLNYPSIRTNLADANKVGVSIDMVHRIDFGPGMYEIGRVEHYIRDSQVDAGLTANSIWHPPSSLIYTADVAVGETYTFDVESEVIGMVDDLGSGVEVDTYYNKHGNYSGPVVDILAIGRNN